MRATAASKKAPSATRRSKKPLKTGAKNEEKRRSPVRKAPATGRLVERKNIHPARKTMVTKPMRKTSSQKTAPLKKANTVFRVKPRPQVSGRTNPSGARVTQNKGASVRGTVGRFVVKALSVKPKQGPTQPKKKTVDTRKAGKKSDFTRTGKVASGRGQVQPKNTKSCQSGAQSDAKAKLSLKGRSPVQVIQSPKKTRVIQSPKKTRAVTRDPPRRVSIRSLNKEVMQPRSPRSPPLQLKTRPSLKRSASTPQSNVIKRVTRMPSREKNALAENGSGVDRFRPCVVRLTKNPEVESLSQADSAKEAFAAALSLGKKPQTNDGVVVVEKKIETPECEEKLEELSLKKADDRKKKKVPTATLR